MKSLFLQWFLSLDFQTRYANCTSAHPSAHEWARVYISLSREPFSYTQNWLQVFPLVHGFLAFDFFPLSKVLHLQGRAWARNQLFFLKKFLYSSSNSLFSCIFGAFMMHHMHEHATNHPLSKWTPFQKQFACHFATYRDCLSYSRPYLCASTHNNPTQTVCD